MCRCDDVSVQLIRSDCVVVISQLVIFVLVDEEPPMAHPFFIKAQKVAFVLVDKNVVEMGLEYYISLGMIKMTLIGLSYKVLSLQTRTFTFLI